MRVAVVGSGISGLAAARSLAATHRVELFEAADRPGGHVNTVDIDGVPVDTGFIIHNQATYPGLTRLFRDLDVPTRPTEMSFSSTCGRCAHTWGSGDARAIFAQARNLARPSHWLMLAGIVRFFREAGARLEAGDPSLERLTLGELVRGRGHAARHFILPMGAAIWSTSTAELLDFPAASFLRFWKHHGMLQTGGGPTWRTIVGGSRVYVDRLIARLDARVHLATPVVAVRREAAGVTLTVGPAASRRQERFDALVLAVHSDTALAILGDDATPAERSVLGRLRYTPNDAWLHTDERFLPPARRAWSSWNVAAADCRAPTPRVEATYWMNRLQGLPGPRPFLVTLNPTRPIDARKVIRRIDYAHPRHDFAALDAQARVPSLQGARRTWFAGAWLGHGFHEDGFRAGEEAAASLGAWARAAARERVA